jgi:hypothetical protein
MTYHYNIILMSYLYEYDDIFKSILNKLDIMSLMIFKYTDQYIHTFINKNYSQTRIESHLVAKTGHLNILQWMYQNNCYLNSLTLPYAAISGNLEMIKWLQNYVKWQDHHIEDFKYDIWHKTKNQWIVMIGTTCNYYDHEDVNKLTTFNAAKYGHLHILEYLNKTSFKNFEYALEGASSGGQLHILEWCKGTSNIDFAMIFSANLETLKWFATKTPRFQKIICYQVAKKGIIEMMNWLLENHYEMDNSICYGAAYSGNIELLKLTMNFYTYNKKLICKYAARGGQLKMLEYLYENGATINSKTCVNAIKSGNLEILIWLHDHGCQWNINSIITAVKYNHLEIVKYLIKNHSVIPNILLNIAVTEGHYDMVKYLHGLGHRWSNKVCENAIGWNRLKILRWAFVNGYGISGRLACRSAYNNRNLEILQWLLKQGFKMDTMTETNAIQKWDKKIEKKNI